DLASSSADHGTAINPLTAERIEVLRGPSALAFGSYAIGGVVNVLDARIPRRAPPGRGLVHSIFTYGSAADDKSLHVMGDVPLVGGLVGHFDGNWMRSGNLRTGGYLLSDELRREAAASTSPEVRNLAGLKGELPNTSSRSTEVTGSVGYVRGALNIGASVTRHESRYGVPIRFSLDPATETEAPTLDMRQTRGDARVEVPLDGFLSAVRMRAGIARYRHDEIEDSGEVASSLFSKGGEARLEVAQAERDGWSGTSGAQYLTRSVRIEGDEQYVPNSRHRQFGLFTLQALDNGPLRVEGAARIERSRLRPEQSPLAPLRPRDFTTFSTSVAAGYEFAPGWRAGVTVSRVARAPSIDELYANGPHAASQSYELGDPDIDAERSRSIELSARRTAGLVKLKATTYYTAFSNYIFQSPTGQDADGFPVFAYAQAPAKYYGVEMEAEVKLGRAFGVDWSGELMGDAIRATIEDFGPAPLIPPVRLLGALGGVAGAFDGRIEVEHGFAQGRNAPRETETPAYTLVNAALEWHPLPDKPLLTVTLMGNNLFDAAVRRHSSLLKDYAPLAGRELRLSARLSF
ncbi:MAG TPA: TonB-dependent receptor, partial [Sphingomicrobium sp.]|nr:TonB-dependent receptor [Sphingomicrobium sp.]